VTFACDRARRIAANIELLKSQATSLALISEGIANAKPSLRPTLAALRCYRLACGAWRNALDRFGCANQFCSLVLILSLLVCIDSQRNTDQCF